MAPPHARTIKTLAAALTCKWIVNPEWVSKSKEAGKFIDEQPFGFIRNEVILEGKKVFITPQFKSEQPGKVKHLRILIVSVTIFRIFV